MKNSPLTSRARRAQRRKVGRIVWTAAWALAAATATAWMMWSLRG